MIETSTFRASQASLGALIAIAAHALTIAAAYVAGRIIQPSTGGGFEDLVAVVATLLIGQALVAIICLVGGILMIVRARRDLGLGLLVGWLVGLAIALVIRFT